MKGLIETIVIFLIGEPQANRIVPPTGFTAKLTFWSAAAMSFLAVFALAFALAAGRLADRWSTDLARTSTVRISAPTDQVNFQVQAALEVLNTTPGVESARALEPDELRGLLAPWFGSDLPIEELPIPVLIEVIETDEGLNSQNLQLRFAAEAPGAVMENHKQWRRPLVMAAGRLRFLGWAALGLIGFTLASMVTLAAQSALAANGPVIRVLRLIGSRDGYIAQAFVRRFAIRTFLGSGLGIIAGCLVVFIMPSSEGLGGFLTGLRFSGAAWLTPLCVPFLAGFVGFVATRRAALRVLGELS